MFWIIVGTVVALLLTAAWSYDRRHRGSGRSFRIDRRNPAVERDVAEGTSGAYRNDFNGGSPF